MKKLNTVILFILANILLSCSNQNQTIEIENQTMNKIEDIKISNGFNFVKLVKLNQNEKSTLYLDFNKNNTKSDGNYYLEYSIKNKIIRKVFGYYSNGLPSSERLIIKIYKDTLVVDEKF